MKSRQNDIKIIKSRLPQGSNRPPLNGEEYWPRMPQLYLELLENKDKVKQEIVNKTYTPVEINQEFLKKHFALNHVDAETNDDDNDAVSEVPMSRRLDDLLKERDTTPGRVREILSRHSQDEVKKGFEESSSDKEDDHKVYNSSGSDYEHSDFSYHRNSDDIEKRYASSDDSERRYSNDDDKYSRRGSDDKYSRRGSDDKYSRRGSDDKYSRRGSDESEKRFLNRDNEPEYEKKRYTTPPSFRERMEEQSKMGGKTEIRSETVRDRDFSQFGETSRPKPKFTEAPSLAQLGMEEKKTLPNVQYMKNEEKDAEAKRELLFKFELLKKSYKDIEIEPFSIHSDYKTMKNAYDLTLRRVSVDNSVGQYKTYLIGGFMFVEYVLGRFVGFDMQGFTQQQIMMMQNYERLLIELGEKSYVDEESQWPVEFRLMGMIVVNAAMFVGSKMLEKKTGGNPFNIINSLNTAQAQATAKTKRKMRGPSLDVNNLPNLGDL